MTGQIEPRDESGEFRAPLNTLASKLALGEASGPAPSLHDALRRFRDAQARAAESPADPLAKGAPKPPLDVEARALRKSRKRYRKHLGEGVSPPRAAVLAHIRYRKAGGKSSMDVWSRKVAEGK